MIKTVIFDFDGTIADTHRAILATMHSTFRQLGLPDVADDRMQKVIGLPLGQMFIEAAGITDAGLVNRCVTTYRACFNDNCEGTVELYPDVLPVLEAMKAAGMTLSIATSRGRDSLAMLLVRLGISHLMSMSVTVEDVEHAKPSPDMVLKILAEQHADPALTLVVGDTTFDIGMGSAAGCLTCGVTHGNHSREMLLTASPDYIVDGFGELARLLKV